MTQQFHKRYSGKPANSTSKMSARDDSFCPLTFSTLSHDDGAGQRHRNCGKHYQQNWTRIAVPAFVKQGFAHTPAHKPDCLPLWSVRDGEPPLVARALLPEGNRKCDG